MKKCKGGMTFLEVLEETTVFFYFEKSQSRFKDIAKSAITLRYTVLLSC